MQKDAAKKLIQDTFEGAFDKEKFKKFIKELLNHLEEAPFTCKGGYIYRDFQDSVKSLERIGKYEDSDGKKIDVLIVNLLKSSSLERARSKQRNFVAKYLKGSRGNELKDGALVAFVSPDKSDWRFSFVKMEYRFDTTKKGQPKVMEDFTPARRYSFLVGEHERSHTAQSKLLPILENTENDPTFAEIEEAFSIEKVTKEFFENYRSLYHEVKDELDKLVNEDISIKEDFEEKGVDTIDFSKKLLGQVVFLYFLQKKGWFGVARNEAWGTGPKNFLRLLFARNMSSYENFFNDILEPLFYEALAVERQSDYYSPFKCKIPFLNGGLFDPLNDYDWVHTDILIPNELFSNEKKTKQGDVGTGILDVFDRFNFTVKEDEPLEKEVAVDPEMLGKVFENLLEVKDRKSKGTYYTPREIVHYMCQESLINYLAAGVEGQVEREDIETLIKHGETALENDAMVAERGEEKGRYKYKLPKSLREHNELIDRKLADIKVCDPAVGSGAFLVGMMSEIVKTRSVLARLNNPDKEPNIYDFKRDAIQDSLHGVDIDLGAVEIAKLRLWLSLIVDEEDYKHIKPLPNLDYKIMQGNSLLEEYEGIKLIDERFFQKQDETISFRDRLTAELKILQYEYIHEPGRDKLPAYRRKEIEGRTKEIQKQLNALDKPKVNGQDPFDIFGKTEAQSKAEKLLKLHEEFFHAHHKSDKDRLKKQIDQLTWDLIETTLKQEGKQEKLEDVKRFQRTNTRPFFLWKLNFADVFRNNQGFDIVIANPPYIEHKKLKSVSKYLKHFCTYTGTSDLYVYFYEQGMSILRSQGTLVYISSNKFIRTSYGRELRKLISEYHLSHLIDFTYIRVFEALVASCILIIQKESCHEDVFVSFPNGSVLKYSNLSDYFEKNHIQVPKKNLGAEIWQLSSPEHLELKDKLDKESITIFKSTGIKIFRGVTTGCNEAFVINEDIRNDILSSDLLNSEIIKPLIQGRDIKKWFYVRNPKYIIFTRRGIDIKKYPTIKKYLNRFKQNLTPGKGRKLGDYAWYEIQDNTAYFSEFENEKIIWGLTADKWAFAYDDSGSYLPSNGYILTSSVLSIKYLLALLNSKLLRYYFNYIGIMTAGGAFTLKRETIRELPIKEISDQEESQIINLVDSILKITRSEDYINNSAQQTKVKKYEDLIDQLVYKLYGLTPEEIKIVEGANNG